MNTRIGAKVRNAVVLALMGAAGLSAMHTARADDQGDSSAQGAQLAEVSITAQRRREDLQEVPLAVSAFSEADLGKRQVVDSGGIIKLVPNVFGDPGSGPGTAANFSIRGQYSTEVLPTFETATGIYVDDVIVSRYGANNFSLLDVERIEVLRGPQGTLFGRNTTGGAVRIMLKKPAEEFGGTVELGYGSFERVSAKASLDLPINDTFLTKLSGFYVEDDGWVKNRTVGGRNNDLEDMGGRIAVRALLSDTVRWDMAVESVETHRANIANREIDGDRVSFSGLQALGSLVTGKKSTFEGNTNRVDSLAVTSNLQIDTVNGGIEVITGYRDLRQRYNLDFIPGVRATGGAAFAQDSSHEQMTQEIKYTGSSNPDRYNLTAGVYYLSEDNDSDYADTFTTGTGLVLIQADRRLRNTTSSYAAYTQVDYKFTPALTATLGVRYTDESKDIDFTANPNPRWLAPFNSQNLVAAGIPLDQKTQLVTPRAALSWSINDDLMVFASATRGFKSGGWNARSPDPQTLRNFGPEKVWSYETGFRSEWFDKKVRLNTTLFFTELTDTQISANFINSAGTLSFITRNYSDYESYGAEFELATTPIENLNVTAALGLMRSEFVNPNPDILAQAARCRAQVAAGAVARPDCGQGIVTPTGTIADPARTPETTFSLGVDYTFQVSQGLQLVPAVAGRYIGDHNISSANAFNAEVDAFWNLDAGLTLRDGDDKWAATLECANCTDDAHLLSVLAGAQYFSEPRRVNFRVRMSF